MHINEIIKQNLIQQKYKKIPKPKSNFLSQKLKGTTTPGVSCGKAQHLQNLTYFVIL